MDNTGWVPRCAMLCPLDHPVSMTKRSPGEIQAHRFLWNHSLQISWSFKIPLEDEQKEIHNENVQVYQQKPEPCAVFQKKFKIKRREETRGNWRTAHVFANSGWVNKFRHRINIYCVMREQLPAKSEFLSGHTHLHLIQRAKTRTQAPQLLWHWEELLPGHWAIV